MGSSYGADRGALVGPVGVGRGRSERHSRRAEAVGQPVEVGGELAPVQNSANATPPAFRQVLSWSVACRRWWLMKFEWRASEGADANPYLWQEKYGCGAKATCDDGPGRIIVRGIDDEFDEFVGGVAGVVAAGGVGKASRRVALTVVDASVVIAVLDPNDVHHATASAAIRDARRQRGSSVIVPASAYVRVLVHPARSGRRALALVRRFRSEQLTVEPLSAEMAEAAARLRARHKGLRLPDALVIATARRPPLPEYRGGFPAHVLATRPSHDQCGMRRPSGTSAAESW